MIGFWVEKNENDKKSSVTFDSHLDCDENIFY